MAVSEAKGPVALIHSFEFHAQNPRWYYISRAHEESFHWIWGTEPGNPGFTNWLRSEDPLFWISGKPGAGKSTLMRYLAENKYTMSLLSRNTDASILVPYFFHELGESQEKTFGGLLYAIVYQLLTNFHDKKRTTLALLYGLLKPHFRPNITSRSALPDDVLMTVLENLVTDCRETIRLSLFIDGFDECHGNHGEQLDFLTNLVRFSSDKKLSIRACIASRVETEIQFRLSNEPIFAIHKFTEKDISAYVTSRLIQAWDLMARQPGGTTSVYDQFLVDKVAKKAEGVFVWVKIVVSQLALAIEEEANIQDLYSLLDAFPEGLEDLYSSILNKIDKKLWPDTVNFLRLLSVKKEDYRGGVVVDSLLKLSCAIQDPMSAVMCRAKVEEGFTIDDANLPHNQCVQVKRRLQRSCRGFIEIGDAEDLSSARVTLLHLTVGEYLSRSQRFKEMLGKVDKRSLRDPAVALMAMSLRLLKSYPHYLPSRGWKEDWIIEDGYRYRLIDYVLAAMGTADRSSATLKTAYVEELDRVLSLIHRDWTTLTLPTFNNLELGSDILSIAVYHGLTFYLQHQIVTKGKGIIQRARYRPLLFYAIDGLIQDFRYDTFEVLLNNGADPMETFNGHTPWSYLELHFGTQITSKEVAKHFELMLELGADPTERVTIYNPTMKYTTTFHRLLRELRDWSHANEKIVRSLIDHCHDLEATDSNGVGIQEWADYLNPDMGAFLRQEIAAKKQSTLFRADVLAARLLEWHNTSALVSFGGFT